MNMLLANNGLTTKCLLNYGISKKDLCPNCIYDPNLKKSANTYKTGGPKPFVNGRICPYCNGAGYHGLVKVDEVYLAVIWDYKYWINKPINIQNPAGMIQTICHRSLFDKLKKAKDLTIVYRDTNTNPLFKLSEEPNPVGLGDNNYLICNWERTGISSITESMVSKPLVGLNTANYGGTLGNITFDVGSNGGPSAYGTYDQNGNAEEWTGTRDGIGYPIQIKVGGGYAGSDASALLKGNIYGAIESGVRYRGFRVATLSNPNDYSNFVLVDDKYNRNDTNGYGGVGYEYYIGKYEITYTEWCDFINSVASYTSNSGIETNIDYNVVDPGTVWGNPIITSDTYNLINNSFLTRVDYVAPTGFPGNYTFTVRDDFANKPVTNVSWINALRYCNWLHNSKPSGYQTVNNDGTTPNTSTTENGAYNLNGATSLSSFINPSSSAKYRLPTIHEWYKSAFYKNDPSATSLPCSVPSAGYWNYATQYDELPSTVNSLSAEDISVRLIYDTSLNSQSGIVVLPLSNPIDVVVDWGDGSIENFDTDGQKVHTYNTDGEYDVKIFGNMRHMNNTLAFIRDESDIVYSQQDKLVSCSGFGSVGLETLERFFYGCSELVSLPSYIPTTITSIKESFGYCTSLNSDPIGSGLLVWDTSNITDMSFAFRYAMSFDQDISSWDTSNVTTMAGMFRDALDFNQNINNWNTSSLINISQMFRNAITFDQPLNNWNVGKLIDMSFAFATASSFDQDISSWDTGSLTNAAYLFSYTKICGNSIIRVLQGNLY